MSDPKFPLPEASAIAADLCQRLRHCFDDYLVAGSIRRLRPMVKDIDIVAMVCDRSALGMALFDLTGEKVNVTGQIVHFNFDGMSVDLYLAAPNTFPIISLIRTGSAEHNRWLAQRAIAQGKRLNFARGIIMPDGSAIDGAATYLRTRKIDAAETELFAALDLLYRAPWEREINL